ncbi:hypothetical protein LTR42_004861 [Elasticomyces elasticus]|nr:hypothetical protein LTR42_004861 [Elasticomyces elasticus]
MDASPLGAIPAEVRNIIYEFYFAYDEVDIRSRRPALLSTCKQLRNEALSVSYYAPTAFSVTILSDPLDTSLIKWLQIEERRSWLALIQSFKIYTGVQFVWEDFWLENLAALETAGFGADQVDFLIPRDQAWIQDQQMASETVDFTTHIRLRTAMREEASVHRLVSVEFLIHLRECLRDRTLRGSVGTDASRDMISQWAWQAFERRKGGQR